jgi:TrmH family RNA methyltransferase
VAPKLLADLGQHDDVVPELVAVAGMPADDLTRIRLQTRLVLLLDRPGSPGNLGSLIRSADAFGVDGLIVCGHAVDAYEPAVVRASTGSLFALPVVRADAPQPVLDWAESVGLQVIGTDEDGEPLDAVDLRGPVLVVVGNETRGMSAAWRAAATTTAAIPMRGSASSLNAANAGSIVLYEATRQRRAAGPAHQGW